MINKIKKHWKLITLGTLLVPIICILIGLVTINFLSVHFVSSNPIIIINSKIEVSSADVLSLYFSFLGIIIGAYITFGIFAFEMQKQEEKVKSIMEYYKAEIIKSLNMIFHGNYYNISIELSNWIEMSSSIKEHLNETDFELINNLCQKISNSKESKNDSFITDYLNDFFIYFNENIERDKFSVTEFLNLKTITALNSLSSKKINYLGIKKDCKNSKFYKIELLNGEYIYSSDYGLTKCKCSFNNGEPWSGFVREVGEKHYEGLLVNGIREGNGKIVKEEYILEEGKYINGKLFNGKIYGKRIKDSTIDTVENIQLHNDFEEFDGTRKNVKIKVVRIADYNVIDGKEELLENTIKEIKIFGGIKRRKQQVIV